MGLKDEIVKGVKDVKDAIAEATHRSNAEAEQVKRDVAGDQMTPGEKVGSVANQVKESTQASYDEAKRNVRDAT
ncbi:MAG TPA: hypothetical protein VGF98_02605 [Candidatus Tumulicola sp.]|jgi:hypothetical protein